MGKFVNSKGKIRVLAIRRCGMYLYVCRKGRGVWVDVRLETSINLMQRGFTSAVRQNYELANKIVKNNPILKLRDAQPDGLLIDQKPSQLKLGI